MRRLCTFDPGKPVHELRKCLLFVIRGPFYDLQLGKGTKQEWRRWICMSEHALPADLDSEAHRPGCPHYGKGGSVPIADETTGYIDLFCDCHNFADPLVLANKSDI